MPQYEFASEKVSNKGTLTELEASAVKNLSHFADSSRTNDARGIPSRNSSFFRTSHSMQNLYESNSSLSLNANNDFDQNTILQPEKTHLISDKNISSAQITSNHRIKSEIDLKDVIGNIWADTPDCVGTNSHFHLKLSDYSDSNDVNSTLSDKTNGSLNNTMSKSPRNKSANPLSHIVNGSKTLPRKNKFNLDRIHNREKNVFVTTKHVEIIPSKLLYLTL